MHHTARRPSGASGTGEGVPPRADIETRLTGELATVVAGARRRALRDGDRQIDTAHLLHSLLETDPEVRAAFAGADQLARVLGYLVQRSIGYGLRWQARAEGVPPVTPATPVTGWSPAAVRAMEAALARAEAREDLRAGGTDLLAAVAADPDCRAVEVLRHAGVDPVGLVGRLCAASRTA
ncbi:Clp protease N-terminal domain-containing protein [Streptomyces sp. NPDC087440]|uniref:Clp protease N-terminal domain-containing protein n=1 Tax=Streptomyces sp. NPDC087440 TaxID=3365790 RepID=UPI00382BBCBB